MIIKIFCDCAVYWAVPTLLFTNKAFTDLKVLKELFAGENSVGRKFGKLNKIMQDLFLAWLPYEKEVFTDQYFDAFHVKALHNFQLDIVTKYETPQLIAKIHENMAMLEKIAAQIFRLISTQVKGTPEDMKVDPYAISLEHSNEELHIKGLSYDPELAKDIAQMWLYKKELA
jgi:hypothetical protein